LDVRFKQLQLVELADNRALLVVVTNDASVHQHTLEFPYPVNQDQLTRFAARINAEFGGKMASDLPLREGTEAPTTLEAIVIAAVTDLLLKEQRQALEAPVVEGVRDFLRQPEFEGSDRILDTLEAVDERRLRSAIPSGAMDDGSVAIVIGDENREGPYQDMSFVLARYGKAGGIGGVVGLLGPTRMAYGDAVAHVRYVSDVLTELMRKFYED
jgi:heat-inducible transcriptional repressor